MKRATIDAAAALLVIAFLHPAAARGQEPQTHVSAAAQDYDSFMKLTPDQRRARFDGIDAETKVAIVRAHAERWLETNRSRLTPAEVAVFEELVAFITPENYRELTGHVVSERERALRARMRCRVSPDDVSAAFNVLGTTPNSASPRRWTYLSQAKCWVEWMTEVFLEYIPDAAR